MNEASGPKITLGSVFAPPEIAHPRLLVTRGWPAGVDRRHIDQWEPDLAPSAALAAERDTLDAATFEARYRAELASRIGLVAWAARMANGTGVVILGEPAEDEACHRSVLAAVIREQSAPPAS
ncbi:MAG: DUF488 family protein [Chloroflexi bacterium]|nr:DUF488 family protein [Chloroflexota bacterium]MDA1240986.1 DUF488 family protein [Chloroflexota bacterium]